MLAISHGAGVAEFQGLTGHLWASTDLDFRCKPRGFPSHTFMYSLLNSPGISLFLLPEIHQSKQAQYLTHHFNLFKP